MDTADKGGGSLPFCDVLTSVGFICLLHKLDTCVWLRSRGVDAKQEYDAWRREMTEAGAARTWYLRTSQVVLLLKKRLL